MAMPFSYPNFKAFDVNGLPLAGGLLSTYAAGTDTPITLYKDPTFATPHETVIELDANGEALIYSKVPFKADLTDADGGAIDGWPIDNIEAGPYNSYLLIGSTVPSTPAADTMALYTNGTALNTKDSDGVVETFISSAGIQQQSYTAADAGGSANAITAEFNPTITALTDKLRVTVISSAANTGAATFAPDSLIAKDIVLYSGAPLHAGAIPAANYPMDLEYVLALEDWVLLNPVAIPSTYQAILQNRRAKNTAGGTATAGSWLIIPLNVLQEDVYGIVDDSALPGPFSLDAGTYRFEGFSPFYDVESAQTRLYNVTNVAVVCLGSHTWSVSAAHQQDTSFLFGTVTITSTKQFRLEYYVKTTMPTNGLGIPANIDEEIYAQLIITKINN